jgi:signal transduction histidine kinase
MTDLREIKAVKDESERLQELNQVKDEFISLVGHELRTPMTGIR